MSSPDYQQVRYRLGDPSVGGLLAKQCGRGVSIDAASGISGELVGQSKVLFSELFGVVFQSYLA